ncbi:MAG: SDR family NAD(P)-dependent oxidoreductase [Candidatus Thiodiazotropha sp.]
MKLTGNTVFITGGTSGIGLALARQLTALSNQVIICGRNEPRLAAVKKELPNLVTYPCDLTDRHDVRRLSHTLKTNHSRLNILINNAGVQYHNPFNGESVQADWIHEEIHTNLLAPILLTGQLLPHLVSQDRAAVVNITSALAFAAKRSAPVYSATKAALRSFTQALREQLTGTSVSVFEVVPSLVDTPMTQGRGSGKISPESLVEQALDGMLRDKPEIRIEKTRLLYLLYRLSPNLARHIVSKH